MALSRPPLTRTAIAAVGSATSIVKFMRAFLSPSGHARQVDSWRRFEGQHPSGWGEEFFVAPGVASGMLAAAGPAGAGRHRQRRTTHGELAATGHAGPAGRWHHR